MPAPPVKGSGRKIVPPIIPPVERQVPQLPATKGIPAGVKSRPQIKGYRPIQVPQPVARFQVKGQQPAAVKTV